MKKQIQKGSIVILSFTGYKSDGSIFDCVRPDKPLRIQAGEGKLLHALENALYGMKTGDSKRITIQPMNAYGMPKPELIFEVDRSLFSSETPLEKGMEFEFTQPDKRILYVRIVNPGDKKVTVNTNHPLAGETLTFDVKIHDVA